MARQLKATFAYLSAVAASKITAPRMPRRGDKLPVPLPKIHGERNALFSPLRGGVPGRYITVVNNTARPNACRFHAVRAN